MADITASPFVLTKLRVPSARSRVVPRAQLVERLAADANPGLVLVCAPAGYGKTTFLAEWSQFLLKTGVAVAWYALDPGDDDPVPFGAYLVASLLQALGPVPELVHSAQLLRASPEADLQRILPSVINAVVASSQACVLILDDYHLITSPAIHSAIVFLLDHLPETMHIAIGSRSDPPLPLARLRARGQLLDVRAAALRFTVDETAQFLNEVMRLELPAEMVATLEARTEGWIAGLQLAALSLAGRSDKAGYLASFGGSHRYLVDYLLEEVVNRQPEAVQAFLLSTSILERLCGPLCDALLGESSGSEAILRQLEQASLFVVPLDDQGEWYRYHHLFRDFLQTRLNKAQPGRVTALHRAAGAWCAAHGFLPEAAQHAFQTGDWDYAAAFVEQHSFTLIVHSEISTLYKWCSAFPEAVMEAHPLLCILQCWGWVFSFRRQNRGKVEARLQQAEQVMATLHDARARELSEHAAVVRSFLAMTPDPAADIQAQLALGQKALGSYPEGDAGRFSALLTVGYAHMALHDAPAAGQALEAARQVALRGRLYFGVVESTFHLARLAHSQGRLRRAAELCRQGQADVAAMLSRPEQDLPALGCLDIALGSVLLEQNQLAEAERALLHGLDLIGAGMNPYYPMVACVALARLYDIQGRPAEALAYLTRLEEVWPDIAFCTGGLRVLHALRTAPEDPKILAEATAWRQAFSASLGESLPLPGLGPIGAADAYYWACLAWARAQIATGKAQAALPYLERQLASAGAHGLTHRVIELSLLEALAARAVGDEKRVWEALERALAAAEPEGYIRIFDQDPVLTGLLAEAAKHGIARSYIGHLLAVIGVPALADANGVGEASPSEAAPLAAQTHYPVLTEHLSERELEVLRLMARGASNHEIAQHLVITVGTVKSHVNHILVKLEVHNRTEAVARARELGLLKI